MKEVDLFGVFLSPFLVWAFLAFVVLSLLRVLLKWAGAYRHIWHRSLFDLSLYLVILAILVIFARSSSR